jgi:hypothetical protein
VKEVRGKYFTEEGRLSVNIKDNIIKYSKLTAPS